MQSDASQTSKSVTSVESSSVERRWPKRLLLGVVVVGVLVSVAASLSPKPEAKAPVNRDRHFSEEGFQETLSKVNKEFQLSLAQFKTEEGTIDLSQQVSEPASWLTVCRRLNLALVGCGLSLEDIRLLEQVNEEDRIQWWTEHLLEDSRSSDYLAERLTRAYVGTNVGPFLLFRRRKFTLWLSDQLQKNRPYDEIVRELIGAEGLWTDQPAVNFLTATMDENDNGRADPVRLAGRTSRAFLGMRIDCLQCHDDFLGNTRLGGSDKPRSGTQHDFHQLASFYAGAGFKDGNAFTGIHDNKRKYEYKFLGEESETEVEPAVPFQSELLPKDGTPRARLAQWVTHKENKAFARATVNRVWALMFGKPLIAPVDDIPIAGPYPPGLVVLADDFADHQFDFDRLIRLIVQTEVFLRDSRSDRFDITANHEQAWAVFPLTQLRPEQVATSIHQACRTKTVDEASNIVSRLEKFGYVNDFTQGFGDRGEDEFIGQSVTVTQRLLMMNGSLVNDRVAPNPITNASSRIGMLAPTDTKAIEVAFLATMNRLPTGAEQSELCEYLKNTRGDDRGEAMADVYWMLLNSTEFLWNH